MYEEASTVELQFAETYNRVPIIENIVPSVQPAVTFLATIWFYLHIMTCTTRCY